MLFWAIRDGVPVEEMEERINASERTELLTGFALSAASRTAWEDKLRTLGRSLASGLLAEDDATIDTEQMIIAAITDIEGPQLAMLELMVAWRPGRNVAEPLVSGRSTSPRTPTGGPTMTSGISPGVSGHAADRPRPPEPCPHRAEPPGNAPAPRPGRPERQDRRGDREVRQGVRGQLGQQYPATDAPVRSALPAFPRVTTRLAWPRSARGPRPSWASRSIFRFLDAGTNLPDEWAAAPADQQEQPQARAGQPRA